ncbi:MAG: phosphoethanolamine transferase [Flavobacteriia bacterium]|nr:phosphoethanolamine transferase [Flavobacteriia bacterium]
MFIFLILLSPLLIRFNLSYITNIPTIRMIKAWIDFNASYNKLKNASNEPLNKNTILIKNKTRKELHIIVIGESTSAHHMSLYGYKRKTNPLLSKIKNELILFTNVHTEKVHTIESLQDILTFSINNKKKSSIIDILNISGFYTCWLSNQPYFEKSNTPVTIISKRSKYSKFINPINSIATDYHVLKHFRKLIKKNEHKKQVIFVHLKGTHTPYKKNYSKKFDKFKNINSKFGEKAGLIINQYDNSVLFNDYIVYQLIKNLKFYKDFSISLTYFSDHGDEVYDYRFFVGHNQALLPSKYMTNVPCFIWLNNKMKNEYSYSKYQFKNKLKLRHITNTLLDLYQIDCIYFPKRFSFFK